MAFEANEYGRSVAAPGLLFADQPYTNESRVMAEAASTEGGFPVYAKVGLDAKAFASAASATSAVARVVEITPTIAAAAEGGKVSITLGGVKFEATSTASTSTVATIIDDLVSAINNASTGSSLFTATDGTSKITLTAKTAGSAANSISIVCASTDAGVAIANPTSNKTDGADAVSATYFLGIAQRVVTRDEYPVGAPVNVITFGRMWVKVAAAVSSGNTAYITSDGKWGASGTQISNVKYCTSASADGYAVVEIK